MVCATRVIYGSALALAALVAFGSLSLPRSAHADFSNGSETFDGTVKDTDTWVETVLNPPGESISQNNEMTLTATTLSVDYTTRFTVGVGDTVSVELISVTADEGGLYLTDDSQGTALPSPFDANTLRLTYRASIPAFVASVGGAGGTLIGLGTPAPPSASSPYTLEIERTSSTLADFRVFDNSMTLIGSTTLFFSGFPARLAISLVSTNTTTVFDNVSAPEPCGNGFTEGVEECDDGNTADNDGCSSECLNEFCGDGVVNDAPNEECDDGNNDDGDCCSSTCSAEDLGSQTCGTGGCEQTVDVCLNGEPQTCQRPFA